MGSAMLTGWKNSGYQHISISDPTHANNIELNSITTAFDVVVLAIKPQDCDVVLPPLQRLLTPKTIVISIMAGVSIDRIKNLLNHDGALFRAMPNTPAMIGAGITAITSNSNATDDQKKTARALLAPLGDVIELNDETLMNAVTAVSGSGPAYVFHLIETLAAAGVAQGLPPDMAMSPEERRVTCSFASMDGRPAFSSSMVM